MFVEFTKYKTYMLMILTNNSSPPPWPMQYPQVLTVNTTLTTLDPESMDAQAAAVAYPAVISRKSGEVLDRLNAALCTGPTITYVPVKMLPTHT